MIIRKATPADFQALNKLFFQIDELHRKLYPQIFQSYQPAPPRSRQQLIQWIENPDSEIIVAEDRAAGIVGVIKWVIESAPSYHSFRPNKHLLVDEIIVDEEFRSRDIGSLLMEEAREWARHRNISQIQLNVYEDNAGSHKFYEKLGYQTLKRRLFLDL